MRETNRERRTRLQQCCQAVVRACTQGSDLPALPAEPLSPTVTLLERLGLEHTGAHQAPSLCLTGTNMRSEKH